MKVAFECPDALLSHVEPLGDFNWILAHKVLSSETYSRYFSSSIKFKVLDNSVNELGEPLSVEDIKKAATLVNPDLIVAPDFLGDRERTLSALVRFEVSFPESMILPVIQGSDPSDCLKCAGIIKTLGYKRVSIPYDLGCSRTQNVGIMGQSRWSVVTELRDFEWIHLLGMTTVSELENYFHQDNIRSIDTGQPIRLGLELKCLDFLVSKEKPTLSHMEGACIGEHPWSEQQAGWVYKNIAQLRAVLEGLNDEVGDF